MSTILLATHNPHKLAEFRAIIGSALPGVEIGEYDGPEPVESGLSFEENALIKARAAASHTGLPALADDSGICVDALSGMPGVFSAYWAGHAKDDARNRELLLDQLLDIPEPERRGARFVAVHALVVPRPGAGPAEHVVRGEWAGRLAAGPAGAGGFGYDPIFIPQGDERTAAQLSAEEKSRTSHRRMAFDALLPLLASTVGL